ncbi:hypothetical protein THAOC_29342 [Thalassiosira oceanica]|uniref:Uncharacterized protein n=1 Tax=Thalassiosira oceanica TaxID=159749 RepID=K0RGP2_THAOC|nr:hypothetical protein THAOC_29342 [Thalassiosira oceanica]|eukprot:EJK51479.1 hypothetical protein THAOC_29342 [Thalassiosira oceanica]
MQDRWASASAATAKLEAPDSAAAAANFAVAAEADAHLSCMLERHSVESRLIVRNITFDLAEATLLLETLTWIFF